jgi:hypothetical protein
MVFPSSGKINLSALLSRDPNIEVEVSHPFEIKRICNLYALTDFNYVVTSFVQLLLW